ncbi:MAG: DUF1259 domain-containing protein, partial [Allosphingosinicella sp.]
MTATALFSRRAGRCLAALAPVLALACGGQQERTDTPRGGRVVAEPRTADANDVRWDAVRRVFGLSGKYEDGYFRVEFPRSDLAVRIGQDALEPEFEFVSHFSFAATAPRRVMGMGEVVMRQDEATAA